MNENKRPLVNDVDEYVCSKGHITYGNCRVLAMLYSTERGYYQKEYGPFCLQCYGEFWEDKLPKAIKKEVA